MATDNLNEHFTEEADAFRQKYGTENKISPQDFAKLILGLYSAKEIYEVGDYLETESSTSPAERFGGDWEELPQGTFTMSAGKGGQAGQTGGSNTHTNTIEEMAQHRHEFQVDNTGGHMPAGTTPHSVATTGQISDIVGIFSDRAPNSYVGNSDIHEFIQYTGGGQAYDNRPQYRTTHKWRKVA